jgi:WD40 repeat protein
LDVVLPPVIDLSPTNTTVWEGQMVAWSVTASGTPPLLRQWQREGADLAGATNATLSWTNVQVAEEGSYRVVVSNRFGFAVSPSWMLYVESTNPIYGPPIIQQHPQNTVVALGAATNLNVTAIGRAPLRYQWHQNDVSLPGQTNTALSIPSFQPANIGIYTVAVSNRLGWAVSQPAWLATNAQAPNITGQPASQTVTAGTNVTLEVEADGLAPLHYEWRVHGDAVPGATDATLTLTNIQVRDAGDYEVVITNVWGSVTSQTATVQVSLFDILWMKGGSADSVVTYSPDGTLAATACGETVRLWRVADGTLLRILPAHRGGTSAVAFSPSGDLLATGGADRTVRLWRVSDGILFRILKGHAAPVAAVTFSPDGTLLASAGDEQNIKLWRVSDGVFLRNMIWQAFTMGQTGSLVFTPDGTSLITGSYSTANGFRVSDGLQLWFFMPLEHGLVKAVALSPDGGVLAVGSQDGTVTLIQMSDRTLLRTLDTEGVNITCVAFSPDGNTVAAGTPTPPTAKVRLWRTSAGTVLRDLDHPVYSIAFSPTGDALLTAGGGFWDDTLLLWRTSDGAVLRTLSLFSDPDAVAFSPDGGCVAVGTYPNVTLFRTSDGTPLRVLNGAWGGLAFSPDGEILATGGLDGTLKLWRFSDGILVRTLTGLPEHVNSVAFALDGAVVAAEGDTRVRVWRVTDGDLLHSWTNGAGFAWGHSMAASPDGSLLTFTLEQSDMTNILAFYRPADGVLEKTITNAVWSHKLFAVAFSPDGRLVASAGIHSPLELCRVADGVRLRTLPSPSQGTYSLAFSQNGEVLAAADSGRWDDYSHGQTNTYDASLRFWRVADGVSLREVDFWVTRISTVVRSPSPGLLAVALEDGTLIVGRDPLAVSPPPPPTLSAKPPQPDQQFRFSVSSQPGFNYRLQTSTNLSDWRHWRTVVCTNATHEFQDTNAPSAPERFYRAVQP